MKRRGWTNFDEIPEGICGIALVGYDRNVFVEASEKELEGSLISPALSKEIREVALSLGAVPISKDSTEATETAPALPQYTWTAPKYICHQQVEFTDRWGTLKEGTINSVTTRYHPSTRVARHLYRVRVHPPGKSVYFREVGEDEIVSAGADPNEYE